MPEIVSLAKERKGIDDWKSLATIYSQSRSSDPIYHLCRGFILPSNYGRSIGTKPPLDLTTNDEITTGFYIPNVLFNKVTLTGYAYNHPTIEVIKM